MRRNGRSRVPDGAGWTRRQGKDNQMRGKLIFITGVGVGYVLGTRAGRERFDQMVAQARKFWESPTVQEAAGVVQAQAGRLYEEGKQVVADQARRMSHRTGRA